MGPVRPDAQEDSTDVKMPEPLLPPDWGQQGTNKGTMILECQSSVMVLRSRATALDTFNALDRGPLMCIKHIKDAEYKRTFVNKHQFTQHCITQKNKEWLSMTVWYFQCFP